MIISIKYYLLLYEHTLHISSYRSTPGYDLYTYALMLEHYTALINVAALFV